jgi:tetratricopeptide (TPR) repeat protein
MSLRLFTQKKTWALLGFLSLTIWLLCCSTEKPTSSSEALPYRNLAEDVKYVGMAECRKCHPDKHDSFIHTGMGQSFDHATTRKSKANFSKHNLVYDTLNNLYYHPFLVADSLYVKEFRLAENGRDTIHQLTQKIDFIIGSGQHTNSHIYNLNGYLYQAPITYYTQEGVWDLAPGFNNGYNSRFDRIIGKECMTCHNSLPAMITGSENKYEDIPLGIACERCHGPGELHIREKQAGNIIDTAKFIDYSIVNPKRLPREYELSVCQRCHIQGISILKEGKDYDDFKPGMKLEEVMDIYLPEYSGAQTKFIMASQAHRLTKSNCYKQSNMTCLSCHNPHISVKNMEASHWNKACNNCHSDPANTCKAPIAEIADKACYTCHMPPSGSIDIPHVTITDHYIRKPLTESQKQSEEKFIGLKNTRTQLLDHNSLAMAYLKFFEEFQNNPAMLDSAAHHLALADHPSTKLQNQIHLYYLQGNYQSITAMQEINNTKTINDGWTAYRIGEALLQENKFKQAAEYFLRATNLLPYQQNFKAKHGYSLLMMGKTAEAQKLFESILNENPMQVTALTNLGHIYLSQANFAQAKKLIEKAIHIDPDYVPGLINYLAILNIEKNTPKMRTVLNHVLQLDPNNTKAKDLLKTIQ